MTPLFRDDPEDDLPEHDPPRHVNVYPGEGICIPIKSDPGPILIGVTIGTPEPHPESTEPALSWSSPAPINLGSRELTVESIAAPPQGLRDPIELPTTTMSVRIDWEYGPPRPDQVDPFTEKVFLYFW